MNASASSVQVKLRQYLSTLPDRVLLRVAHEIGGNELSGHADPSMSVILSPCCAELEERHPDKVHCFSPDLALFSPVSPFLVANERGTKHPGRIRRSTLAHLWQYLLRDCSIETLPTLARDIALDELADGFPPADSIETIGQLIVPPLANLGEKIAPGSMGRDRLISQIGGQAVAEDIADVATIVEKHQALRDLHEKIPACTEILEAQHLAAFDTAIGQFEQSEYAIPVVLMMTRLAHPSSILRILLDAEKVDDAAILARSRYAVVVEVLINEMSLLGDQCAEHVNIAGRSEEMIACLRSFHHIGSGLTTAIALETHGPWMQRIAQARRKIADIARREVEQIPAKLRLAIQPGGGANAPDSNDIEVAVEAARLMVAVKPLRSELALNETVGRIAGQVDSLLDAAARGLPQQARSAGDGGLAILSAQFAALCRIAHELFGEDYARLLTRSGQVAGLHTDLSSSISDAA